MTARRLLLIAFACLLALVAAACDETDAPVSGDGADRTSTSSSGSPAPSAAAPTGPQFGTAGLIPRNYPNAEADDWRALYRAAEEAGPLIGLYGGWRDEKTADGEIPSVFQGGNAGIEENGGITPVVALGFATEDVLTGVMQTTLDWSDPAAAALFTEIAVAIVEEYEPPFFVLGAEINRIWEQHPADYEAFVAAWPPVYDAIKAASPRTEVGASFQLEIMRGAGYLTGQSHPVHWDLLEAFEGYLDFVGLSTYPFLDFESPEAMPEDYYREVADRTGLPIAFTEMGWPSQPLSNFPESGYGGSPSEQTAFAVRFLELIEDVDVRFALWSFQHDVGPSAGPAFETVALRENDGTPKPALAIWQGASR